VTSHRLTLDLPYRPEDLFELASDVARYPEFIKWILSLKVSDKREGAGRVRCRAEARVGFKGFHETFVTDVEARPAELAIDVGLVRGPFKKLSNAWRLQPIESGTRVVFTIQFEFRNFVLQTLADANKTYAVQKVIDAFVSEAAKRYRKIEAKS
jgi:coenzyme Q-binding protein COQ10